MITFVWAEDQKRQIGLKGHLPWHLPADMRHFKELTTGHPIVMGRKTFMSLPRILPDRQHIVLTSREDLAHQYVDNKQVVVLPTLGQLNDWLDRQQKEEVCVIGGAALFKALQERADRLEKTLIKAVFEADTVMPNLDYRQFELISRSSFPSDEQNKYAYEFLTYQRKDE